MLTFFARSAFAVFAFLGPFIVNLDDTSTRIYDNSAFRKRNLANRWQMFRMGGLRYTAHRVKKVVRRNIIIRRETRESRADSGSQGA